MKWTSKKINKNRFFNYINYLGIDDVNIEVAVWKVLASLDFHIVFIVTSLSIAVKMRLQSQWYAN